MRFKIFIGTMFGLLGFVMSGPVASADDQSMLADLRAKVFQLEREQLVLEAQLRVEGLTAEAEKALWDKFTKTNEALVDALDQVVKLEKECVGKVAYLAKEYTELHKALVHARKEYFNAAVSGGRPVMRGELSLEATKVVPVSALPSLRKNMIILEARRDGLLRGLKGIMESNQLTKSQFCEACGEDGTKILRQIAADDAKWAEQAALDVKNVKADAAIQKALGAEYKQFLNQVANAKKAGRESSAAVQQAADTCSEGAAAVAPKPGICPEPTISPGAGEYGNITEAENLKTMLTHLDNATNPKSVAFNPRDAQRIAQRLLREWRKEGELNVGASVEFRYSSEKIGAGGTAKERLEAMARGDFSGDVALEGEARVIPKEFLCEEFCASSPPPSPAAQAAKTAQSVGKLEEAEANLAKAQKYYGEFLDSRMAASSLEKAAIRLGGDTPEVFAQKLAAAQKAVAIAQEDLALALEASSANLAVAEAAVRAGRVGNFFTTVTATGEIDKALVNAIIAGRATSLSVLRSGFAEFGEFLMSPPVLAIQLAFEVARISIEAWQASINKDVYDTAMREDRKQIESLVGTMRTTWLAFLDAWEAMAEADACSATASDVEIAQRKIALGLYKYLFTLRGKIAARLSDIMNTSIVYNIQYTPIGDPNPRWENTVARARSTISDQGRRSDDERTSYIDENNNVITTTIGKRINQLITKALNAEIRAALPYWIGGNVRGLGGEVSGTISDKDAIMNNPPDRPFPYFEPPNENITTYYNVRSSVGENIWEVVFKNNKKLLKDKLKEASDAGEGRCKARIKEQAPCEKQPPPPPQAPSAGQCTSWSTYSCRQLEDGQWGLYYRNPNYNSRNSGQQQAWILASENQCGDRDGCMYLCYNPNELRGPAVNGSTLYAQTAGSCGCGVSPAGPCSSDVFQAPTGESAAPATSPAQQIGAMRSGKPLTFSASALSPERLLSKLIANALF